MDDVGRHKLVRALLYHCDGMPVCFACFVVEDMHVHSKSASLQLLHDFVICWDKVVVLAGMHEIGQG